MQNKSFDNKNMAFHKTFIVSEKKDDTIILA